MAGRSYSVQLELQDWAKVMYALARFAFLHPDDEEKKLPKAKAHLLLRGIDSQIEAQRAEVAS